MGGGDEGQRGCAVSTLVKLKDIIVSVALDCDRTNN